MTRNKVNVFKQDEGVVTLLNFSLTNVELEQMENLLTKLVGRKVCAEFFGIQRKQHIYSIHL